MPLTQLVILDFDGTCTNVEEEGKGFVAALIGTLSRMTGESGNIITALYEEGEERLRAEADSHGWVVNGLTVAPAIVDPYLRSKPIARWILEHCNVAKRELDLRLAELDGPLFKTHYAKSGVALRPELAEVLGALHDLPYAELAFVTNSDTSAVEAKLGTLGLDWTPRVIGDAKKYIASAGLEAHLPGLKRGILLRRPHYRNVLDALMGEREITADAVTVVGDIYELDLAVPDHLGMRTVLMVGPNTPTYERQYMLESDTRRRATAGTLIDALGFIVSG